MRVESSYVRRRCEWQCWSRNLYSTRRVVRPQMRRPESPALQLGTTAVALPPSPRIARAASSADRCSSPWPSCALWLLVVFLVAVDGGGWWYFVVGVCACLCVRVCVCARCVCVWHADVLSNVMDGLHEQKTALERYDEVHGSPRHERASRLARMFPSFVRGTLHWTLVCRALLPSRPAHGTARRSTGCCRRARARRPRRTAAPLVRWMRWLCWRSKCVDRSPTTQRNQPTTTTGPHLRQTSANSVELPELAGRAHGATRATQLLVVALGGTRRPTPASDASLV
jgi:hypothetical protein